MIDPDQITAAQAAFDNAQDSYQNASTAGPRDLLAVHAGYGEND